MQQAASVQRWLRDASFGPVVHGLTVAAVLADVAFRGVSRDLDCVELFSGRESVVTAARVDGFAAMPFDKARALGAGQAAPGGVASEDLMIPDGFRTALFLIFRLRQRGLLWTAPPCTSFPPVCRRQSGRSRTNVAGDTTANFVRMGNSIAQAAAFLMTVAATST